ncbi:MAG: hypothetical protein ACI85U_001384, partial [Candidatus Promineifilaceae bacterium]
MSALFALQFKDMSYSDNRAQFGQNFLVHGKTVRKLVRI